MFTIKQIPVEAGENTVILNSADAYEMGVRGLDRVKISSKKHSITAIVEISKKLIKANEVGLLTSAFSALQEKEGVKVDVTPATRPNSIEYIKKKMNDQELTYEEILRIIKDIVNKNLSDIELAAYVSAVYTRGMSLRETKDLTLAMIETGDTIDFDQEKIYDFHSIGGVPGNKVTLLVVPIIAASGLIIPKTSSRAISSPCGTADIFEVLANVTLTAAEIKHIAETVGGTIAWGGGVHIAPADDIIIRAEYPLAIDPYSQVIASVMAKKKAAGVNRLVLDIPVGKNTKVESFELAKKYGHDMIAIGDELGMRVECAITYGSQPVGRAVGPSLEAREALMALENKKVPNSLLEKSISLSGMILEMGNAPPGTGREKAKELLCSGRALKKMKEIIDAQGGDPDVTSDSITVGKYTLDVTSDRDGYVDSINNKTIVKVTRAAGAPKSNGAGLMIHKKKGMKVDKDEPIYTIYADSTVKMEQARKIAFKLRPILIEGMVLDTIGTSDRIFFED
ncbi:AMP phosphorylase [[Eubacterium] cellulosolvens]